MLRERVGRREEEREDGRKGGREGGRGRKRTMKGRKMKSEERMNREEYGL